MFVAIYRWRLKPGREAEFTRAWSRLTSLYVERFKSGGSALFEDGDGVWVGIARWQSRDARARAFAGGSLDAEASAAMRDATLEVLPDMELECVDDRWVFPMPAPSAG